MMVLEREGGIVAVDFSRWGGSCKEIGLQEE